MRHAMQIGEVGRRLGLNPKTIRYYEEVGLLPKPKRTRGRYRQYTTAEIERIDLIRRARALDLSLDEIRQLLDFRDKNKSLSADVLHRIETKVRQIERRIVDLRELRRELAALRAKAADAQGADNESR